MKDVLISVVVPCYNVSKYLGDCFKSISDQTYKNFEIIFVNDGSTDDTLEKIKAFCSENKFAHFIDQKNQGVSVARNNGVKASKGEFVCFLDADDFWHCDALRNMHKALTESNADCAVMRYKWVSDSQKYIKTKSSKNEKLIKTKIYEDKDMIMSYFFSGKFGFGPWNKLYKKQVFKLLNEDNNLFDKEMSYGEDAEFNTRYFDKTNKVAYINEKLYFYRQRKGGAIYSKFNTKKLSIFKWIETANNLDKDIYIETQNYIKAREAMINLEMLFRIINSEYSDLDIIQKLYFGFCDNKKYISKSKNFPSYLKFSAPMVPLYLKMALGKRGQRCKKD